MRMPMRPRMSAWWAGTGVRRPGPESTTWTWQPRVARWRAPARAAALGQVARPAGAAAAVAARPGQHRDRPRREPVDCQLGEAAAGVLHHLDELDVQVLDHDPVDFTHLLGGQRREFAPAETVHGPSVAPRGPRARAMVVTSWASRRLSTAVQPLLCTVISCHRPPLRLRLLPKAWPGAVSPTYVYSGCPL